MKRRAAEVLIALALALPAVAQERASSSSADALRPSGPVTITADNVEWVKGGAMIYTGNVKLASDTLQLSGVRMELRQHPGGQFEARLSGSPATLDHAGTTNQQGEKDPTVTARSRTLNYDSRSSVIEVAGDALMTRGDDQITGETIRYNVSERRIQAMGGSGGQVKIIMQAPPGSLPKDEAILPKAAPAEPEKPKPLSLPPG